jgi:hypothetical protein
MDNLNIEHHVKLRNMLYKRQIEVSEKIRSLCSIDFRNAPYLAKRMAEIDLDNYELELELIGSDIIAQETLINSYMDNLE